MRKLNTKRSGEECLLIGVRNFVAVAKVANVRSGSEPSLASQGRFPHRVQYRFHTVIKLRIRFLAVNQIERVGRHVVHIGYLKFGFWKTDLSQGYSHFWAREVATTYFEIKPLAMMTRIDVWSENQVVFPGTDLKQKTYGIQRNVNTRSWWIKWIRKVGPSK